MKKFILILITIFIIVVSIVYTKVNNFKTNNEEIKKFNSNYEMYNLDTLNGLDIISVINKAQSNNEKYGIPKNVEGFYILDDENSIEIYVTMQLNEKTYEMEKIIKLGINKFIDNYGNVKFKCIDIKYHEKTGKVASMTFISEE